MADVRRSLVEEIKLGEHSISELCRRYDVSRPTAYKWLERSASCDVLCDKSSIPHISPNKTSAAIESLIVATRNKYPYWGSRKIKTYLERHEAVMLPSHTTITAILQRHGLISVEASRAATPYKRFEMTHANELWQIDFKGHFPMSDGKRCHPLTVTDDMSRFNLCISAKDNERLLGVTKSFLRLFREYGLPEAVLSDNGTPWGTSKYRGFTRFDVFLMDYDILPMHGRPLHPQTQGKAERFHRTLKRELLSRISIGNLLHAQRAFDVYRREYNELRPHHALGNAVPADKYSPSQKIMPKRITHWEYPKQAKTRSVRKDGFISFNGHFLCLSKALNKHKIAFIESKADGVMDIIYRNFKIAAIDLRCGEIIFKKITRLENKT